MAAVNQRFAVDCGVHSLHCWFIASIRMLARRPKLPAVSCMSSERGRMKWRCHHYQFAVSVDVGFFFIISLTLLAIFLAFDPILRLSFHKPTLFPR
jgi:hypothetical protein